LQTAPIVSALRGRLAESGVRRADSGTDAISAPDS
jgi:hypothetical protein